MSIEELARIAARAKGHDGTLRSFILERVTDGRGRSLRAALKTGLRSPKSLALACDAFGVEPSYWFLTDADEARLVAEGRARVGVVLVEGGES